MIKITKVGHIMVYKLLNRFEWTWVKHIHGPELVCFYMLISHHKIRFPFECSPKIILLMLVLSKFRVQGFYIWFIFSSILLYLQLKTYFGKTYFEGYTLSICIVILQFIRLKIIMFYALPRILSGIPSMSGQWW